MKQKATLKKVKSAFGVTEYRLSNGLRVLYKQQKATPVVGVCVTFHVGSRNETVGRTGATHILEHLLFKDSKKFNVKNGNAITDYLEWFGAYINATTWLDRTNYFELLPAKHAEKALAMEADRMRGSLFTDADLASEMTVVRNEFERSRNNPFELLDEEISAAALTVHPYRIPTIGIKEDIENATAASLREFYDIFYWPNNATLSVFGDISKSEMERLVIKHFGPIPTSPHPIPTLSVVEPPQKKARKVAIVKEMGVSIAALGYKIPKATHADYAPVLVLGTLLAAGFASRLQKTLVDPGLAVDIGFSAPALMDPGIMQLVAHVAEGTAPAKVLGVMRKELAVLGRELVKKDELARAKERIAAQASVDRDGVFADMREVSESIAAGDWTLGYRMGKLVAAVTPQAVRRVAQKYFTPSFETSGTLTEK